jgi:hypothetical protein
MTIQLELQVSINIEKRSLSEIGSQPPDIGCMSG